MTTNLLCIFDICWVFTAVALVKNDVLLLVPTIKVLELGFSKCFLMKAWLRYYATFKVRKFGSFFYKIKTCLQKPTTCIGLQADKALSVNIQDTYFSILGVAFAVSFLCYFQKLQLIVVKKLSIFIALYFIFMSSKSVPQIFKILLQTWDTNIFVLGGVFFIRYVQLKSSFSDEKTAVKSETHFSREAIENQQGKVLKKNSIIVRSWSSASSL